MIRDHDRSGYIGASDVRYVMGSWKGKTFENWWLEKLGLRVNRFENQYTRAGNAWEHRILRALNIPNMVMDAQFINEPLKLRVNLDGNTENCIYEVKTYRYQPGWQVPRHYFWQVQVQMLCSGIHRAELVCYGLRPDDYRLAGSVDPARLKRINVAYDPLWLDRQYLPRHRVLAECLKRREYPQKNI